MIKVSVIIPIYNMGKYLEECLDSVVTQTLEGVEIICINDGSTDQSLEILHKYASKYESIIVLDQNNCGVGIARNNGLDIARGEFVAFMDPDDFYPDIDILECLYNNAKDHQVLICGGSLSSLRGETVIKSYYGFSKDYTFTANQKMEFKKYQFLSGFQRFIYNVDLLRKNNLYFSSYTRYQDPPFFVRSMICAGEFYSIKKITYCYRTGYRKIDLTLKKTIDYAKGILDILIISREYQFKKLQALGIETLLNDLSPAIYKHLAKGDLELEKIVNQINEVIDINLLQDYEWDKSPNPYILNASGIKNFLKENMNKETDFLNSLKRYENIIIYGAGKVGEMTIEYLKSVEGINMTCCAVTDTSKNQTHVHGIPVRAISELISFRNSALILVATFSNLHQEIQDKLNEMKFKNILTIDFKELQLFGGANKL